jgi:hypothetical protein
MRAGRTERLKRVLDITRELPTLPQLMRGHTYNEIALMVGCSAVEVLRWLTGRRCRLSMHDGLALATALCVDPYVLSAYVVHAHLQWTKHTDKPCLGRRRRHTKTNYIKAPGITPQKLTSAPKTTEHPPSVSDKRTYSERTWL